MTIGWKLDRNQRAALLEAFPPRYANAVADHVTLATVGAELPAPVADARIVGHIDDHAGVEAMVVAIDGNTTRPDGKVWHITWSLSDGRAARESNDVIAQLGWSANSAERLILEPACW